MSNIDEIRANALANLMGTQKPEATDETIPTKVTESSEENSVPVLSFADLEQTQPKDYTQDKDYLASRKKLQEDINSLKCLGNLLK